MLWEDNDDIFASFDSDDLFHEYAEGIVCTLYQCPQSDTYDYSTKIAIDYVYAVLVLLYYENDIFGPTDIGDINDWLWNFKETKAHFLSLRKYSTERILIDRDCEKDLFDILDDDYDYRAICRDIAFRFNAWINGNSDFSDLSYVYIF